MKRPLLVLSLLVATGLMAQTPAPAAKRKSKSGHQSSTASLSRQLDELKDAIAAQQQQIQQLQQTVGNRDEVIQQLQQQVGQAQATAQQAQQTAVANGAQNQTTDAVAALQHDVSDLKTVSSNAIEEVQTTQKRIAGLESPASIHYKGVTLTPVGFLAAETVWRSHSLTSDINTPFNSIPYGAASQSQMSEFYGTGRQSRLGMLAQGKLASVDASGYFEADFLSAGTTSNSNQSNSYTLRQRQLWAQAALNSGWTFTGGQMWSLVTETKRGEDNRSEALPMTIDPQYTIGFSFNRQYGFRVTKRFHDKAWLGFAIENSQETLTAHGQAANFLLGGPGNGGGLYNPTANYSWNLSPDYIVKLAFEPGFGHYEFFGIATGFRSRAFPGATLSTPTAAGATNNTVWGGGIGANARWQVANKHVEFGVHYLGGPGIGRYGTGGLPDVTVRPNGLLATLRSNQALGTLEFHGKKLDVYSNFGAEFVGRAYYLDAKGKPVGYGSPLFDNSGCSTETVPSGSNGFTPGSLSKCNGDTRNVMEATFGFWLKPYSGEKGRFQLGPQYSYVVRNTWRGIGGAPNAVDNMVFTSFRYYIP